MHRYLLLIFAAIYLVPCLTGAGIYFGCYTADTVVTVVASILFIGCVAAFVCLNVVAYRAIYESLKSQHDYNNYRDPDTGLGG
jgi:hypothetical protein